MPRDDFKPSIKRYLRDRVANRCSNPSCRVPTISSSSKNNIDSVSFGVAAHICAASEGGPRYDSSMTSKERAAIENGIWLCANCSILIDRDFEFYSVSLLKKWKEEAELKSMDEIGRRLPREDDAINLVSSLMGSMPKNLLSSSISNVHSAFSRSLEKIDPRFKVSTSFLNGKSIFEFHPKSEVELSIKIFSDDSGFYEKEIINFIDHGADINFSSRDILLEGSDIFDYLKDGDGIYSIRKKRLKSIQKYSFYFNGNDNEFFDDFLGEISYGRRTIGFLGYACDFVMKSSLRRGLSLGDPMTLNLDIDFNRWVDFEIKELPFFYKIFSLYEKLISKWVAFSSIEINGDLLFSVDNIKFYQDENLLRTYRFLKYIDSCRVLSSYFGFPFYFDKNTSYSNDEYSTVVDYAIVARSNGSYRKIFSGENPSCEIYVSHDLTNLLDIFSDHEPRALKIVENDMRAIKIFGVDVALPARTIIFSRVLPKMNKSFMDVKPGELVRIEWVAQEGCELLISFDTKSDSDLEKMLN